MQKANGVFCGKGFNHDLCSLAIQRRTTKNYYVEIQKIKGQKKQLYPSILSLSFSTMSSHFFSQSSASFRRALFCSRENAGSLHNLYAESIASVNLGS